MASLTSKEQDMTQKLRSNINDLKLPCEQQSDKYLVRWLRARDLDLMKAEEMLRNSIKWRKENDIDNLHLWTIPQYILDKYPFVLSGLDLEGCPVGIFPLGMWDVKKAVESGHRDTYVKYVDHIMVCQFGEAFRKLCNPNVTQLVLLLDMSGYSLTQVTSMPAIETIMETVRRFDLNHPESLKMSIIINAPTYFSIAFEIVKRVISSKTLSKVHVFGNNPMKWQQFVLKIIPPASLPNTLGGFNQHAQRILYPSSVTKTLDQNKALLHIGPGSELKIQIDLYELDSVLHWSFKLHANDIGFAILFENGHEIYAYQKYISDSKGSIKCQQPGRYTLLFDNSYSRYRGKTLNYGVDIKHS